MSVFITCVHTHMGIHTGFTSATVPFSHPQPLTTCMGTYRYTPSSFGSGFLPVPLPLGEVQLRGILEMGSYRGLNKLEGRQQL